MKEFKSRRIDYKYRFVQWLWTLKAVVGIRRRMCDMEPRKMAQQMK